MRTFDLNIEKILENWEVFHAIRELIANALDEQFLSKTKEISIFKINNSWIIRDYGRGIKYSHLTQNENVEKLSQEKVIGKFGIGLKDALATLERHNIKAKILSKYNEITTQKLAKEGFQDVITLHAIINEDVDPNFIGTEITLIGVEDSDIEKAKSLFLKFSNEEILSETKFGDIVNKGKGPSKIYINGVKVAEEENFLFSYNITSISASIKKALNRERTNVGRTAYAETIKKILLQTRDEKVAKKLADELVKIAYGTASDELGWIDIQEHAVKILSSTGKFVFVSQTETLSNGSLIDEAQRSGITPLIIPENLREKIRNNQDIDGNPIIDLTKFAFDYNDSFVFKFIDPADLHLGERIVFEYTSRIVKLFGGLPRKVASIKISSTMRKDLLGGEETAGCWDAKTSAIVIQRKQLQSLSTYSGTLIHELIHAETNLDDVDRDFETELTKYIGKFLYLYFSKEEIQTSPKNWFRKK